MSRYGTQPTKATFDAEVARLHARDRDDLQIAITLDVCRRTVLRSRHRQSLSPNRGPRGRRINQAVSA